MICERTIKNKLLLHWSDSMVFVVFHCISMNTIKESQDAQQKPKYDIHVPQKYHYSNYLYLFEGLSRKQQPAPKQKTEQNEAEYVDPNLVVNKNRPHKYSELAKPGNTYYLDPVNSKDNNSMKSTAKMNQYELEEEEDYYSLAK